MRLKQFWELTEVYTAPLNLFLILLGGAYAQFHFGVSWNLPFIIYTLTILAFHIAVNIFNNYMDYQNASDNHEYKQKTNIIGREKLSLKVVRCYFILFMALSSLLGFLLVSLTSSWLLFPGLLGFYIGLFYSTGPRPLNSLPIAEMVTALASGYLVPLVALFVLVFPSAELFTARMAFQFLLVCFPLVLMMFNNLLANNTCDLAEDIVNHRRTLVYYIGKERAVRWLKGGFILSFIFLPILVFFGLAPWPILLLSFLFPKLLRGLQAYLLVQDKQTTFPIVLTTMSVMMVGYPSLYFGGLVLTRLIH